MTRAAFLAAGAAALALIAGPSATGKQSSIPASISAADKATGAKAHPALLKEFGGAYAGPQAAYVASVGRRIAVQSGLSNAQGDFTVTLLNSPVNNAFAIPGGYVYITRQLTALANDEAELAGVLGHEIGHVAARHSQQRQKASQRNAIGGALLQVLTGAVFGDSALGGVLQKGIGTGSQLLTLRFSRAQETEADDLGIRYLARAGYDPMAMSTMLASLADQSALDQRLAGSGRSVPEWASTHPDPGERVMRAAEAARATRVTATVRNRDAFLTAINGLMYGDDPQQGMIEGSRFRHPALRLAFSAPSGYGMENSTDAVGISGSGGKGQFSGAAYAGDLRAYVQKVFASVSGENVPQVEIKRTTVNGLPAGYATLAADTQSGQVDVTVFAYEFGPSSAFHFLLITPSGTGIGPFTPMVESMTRLSAQEAAAIRARKVAVVSVKAGDTLESLAGRMAYDDMKLERFLVMNGIGRNHVLKAGQKVKIVI
jgi:predicted Zn-dependent protease